MADFARDVAAPVIGGYHERGEFPCDLVAAMPIYRYGTEEQKREWLPARRVRRDA